MKPLFLIFFVALAASAGFSRDVETREDPDGKLARPPEEVVIALASSNEKVLVLKVTNHTAKPFNYRGYSTGMPIFQIKGRGIGWCGTGVRPQTLEPGKSFTFKVHRTMLRDAEIDEIHIELNGVTSGAIPLK